MWCTPYTFLTAPFASLEAHSNDVEIEFINAVITVSSEK